MNKLVAPPPIVRKAERPSPSQDNVLSEELKNSIAGAMYVLIRKNGKLEFSLRDSDVTSAPILSFKYTPRGELEISPGRVSKNGVFFGGERIKSGSVFTEGVKVSLSSEGIDFILPGLRTTLGTDGIINRIESQILLLNVGEHYQIGRKTEGLEDLPNTLSRKHLVVERLADAEVRPGIFSRKYRLLDGEPETEAVYYKQGESWKKLTQSKSLAPGSFFSVGNPQVSPNALIIEVPEQRDIIDKEECAEPLATRFYTLNPNTLVQLAARAESDLRSDVTMLVPGMDPARNKGNIELVRRSRDIGIYVRAGLKLLAERKYDQAKSHFSDITVLQRCFPDAIISHEDNHVHWLCALDAESVVHKVTEIACDSWFKCSDGKHLYINPSFGYLRDGLVPRNEQEKENLQHFHREIALIYAEEFIHAFQTASDQLISRHAIFLNSFEAHEHDVAMLFRDYGVPISALFTARYERNRALEEAEGIQTPNETKLISDNLAAFFSRAPLDLLWL